MNLYYAVWSDGSRAWVMAASDRECYDELILEKNPWEADVYKLRSQVVMFMDKVDEFGHIQEIYNCSNDPVAIHFEEPKSEEDEE